MKKTIALTFVALTGILTACNPFVGQVDPENPHELCLQQDGCPPSPSAAFVE